MSTKEPEQPSYILPDPHLTLREAVEQHRAMIPGFLEGDDEETATLFTGHDVVHVLFGCSTSPPDEARADMWTVLGTTMTTRRYATYLNNPMVKALASSLTFWQYLESGLGMLDLPAMWWRARHMTQPWDFDSWPEHLDESVESIRASHNIQPIQTA